VSVCISADLQSSCRSRREERDDPTPEHVNIQRRVTLEKLSSLASIPTYQGDCFGTRGEYDHGIHYSFRNTARSNPGSPMQRAATADSPLSIKVGTAPPDGVFHTGSVEDPSSPDDATPVVPAQPVKTVPVAAPKGIHIQVQTIRRARSVSAEDAMASFLSSRPASPSTPLWMNRPGSRQTDQKDEDELPQAIPENEPYDKPGVMSMAEFIERNSGFDEYLLGKHPRDGAKYLTKALGIREILTQHPELGKPPSFVQDSVWQSPSAVDARSFFADEPHPESSPETSPSMKLPPSSPVLLRAAIASRVPDSSEKRELYWKPLAKLERTALVMDPDLPPPPYDPLGELLKDDSPAVKRLKRRVAKNYPDLDLSQLYRPANHKTTESSPGFAQPRPASRSTGRRTKDKRQEVLMAHEDFLGSIITPETVPDVVNDAIAMARRTMPDAKPVSRSFRPSAALSVPASAMIMNNGPTPSVPPTNQSTRRVHRRRRHKGLTASEMRKLQDHEDLVRTYGSGSVLVTWE
jgi:hypothetical protein